MLLQEGRSREPQTVKRPGLRPQRPSTESKLEDRENNMLGVKPALLWGDLLGGISTGLSEFQTPSLNGKSLSQRE